MEVISNILWVDSDIEKEENDIYKEELESIWYLKLKYFDNVKETINYIKKIQFMETKIIVSRKLYIEFIENFMQNLNKINIIPKIIIFDTQKELFIENNIQYENLINHPFYNSGGIKKSFNEIKNFLIKPLDNKHLNKNEDNIQMTFEYIDSKDKLLLPLFYKVLIEMTSSDKLENYTNLLYKKYSKDNKDMNELLAQIKSLSHIPIELLSKYYVRAYTIESNFYHDINTDLGLNKKENHLPFIKALYEGTKLKALPLASDVLLYRGAKISNDEVNKIKNHINKKIEGLPSTIVFSKSFLSFSKEKEIAENYLNNENKNKKLSKVLYILEKNDNIDYSLSTHGDIEKISFYPNEKEVLFFPFSSFEIKYINEFNINGEKRYEINLLYLGKYLKEIENDKSITEKENIIPESEFKKQILEFGLIQPEKIININTKKLFIDYKQYKKDIDDNIFINNKNIFVNNNNIINGNSLFVNNNLFGNNDNDDNILFDNNNNNNLFCNNDNNDDNILFDNKLTNKINNYNKIINKDTNIINNNINNNKFNSLDNYIIGEFEFVNNSFLMNEGNHIINSFEESYRSQYNHYYERNEEKENEYEIKENIEIFINDKKIDFSYYYDFEEEGKYIIKYIFKKKLKNISHMFDKCQYLTKIDLSHFKSENVTNMQCLFFYCVWLKDINFSNFNTQNVADMRKMFQYCESLENVDISNFNTEKITNMRGLFSKCSSLKNLNLLNFNTQKVTDMAEMFEECESLENVDISNFNTENVTDMSCMFIGCEKLKNLNVSNFNTKNVISLRSMFAGCLSLTNLDVSNFNTENVTNMSCMFVECKLITNLNISNFNTENVIDMSNMFAACEKLENLNLSNFNTKNATDMSYIFAGCENLKKLNLSNFNTKNVTKMANMFLECKSLSDINLSSFNSNNVHDMEYMFSGCESLKNLDLSNFDIKDKVNVKCMFSGCKSLKYLNISNFKKEVIYLEDTMFEGCHSLLKKNVIAKDNEILKKLKDN